MEFKFLWLLKYMPLDYNISEPQFSYGKKNGNINTDFTERLEGLSEELF